MKYINCRSLASNSKSTKHPFCLEQENMCSIQFNKNGVSNTILNYVWNWPLGSSWRLVHFFEAIFSTEKFVFKYVSYKVNFIILALYVHLSICKCWVTLIRDLFHKGLEPTFKMTEIRVRYHLKFPVCIFFLFRST